jgi:hypothetical protein
MIVVYIPILFFLAIFLFSVNVTNVIRNIILMVRDPMDPRSNPVFFKLTFDIFIFTLDIILLIHYFPEITKILNS